MWAAAGPSAARKTRGRAPVAARCASERARSASYASSRRTRGSPPPGAARARARARPASRPGSGNSLTPVIGSRRLASFALRLSQVAASRSRDQPGAQGGRLAAGPLDLLEQRPGRVGEFVGEPLHVPGAARRVDHPGQVRLLEQDRGGVAGDTAGERVRQAERVVEGQHGHRVGAADARGQRGDGGAQHVHPRVAPGHHHRRGHGVLALRSGAAGRPAHLGDPGPQPARRAQLGDRQELVGGRRVPELQLPRRPLRRVSPASVSSRR